MKDLLVIIPFRGRPQRRPEMPDACLRLRKAMGELLAAGPR
jgi:hypothetical protein